MITAKAAARPHLWGRPGPAAAPHLGHGHSALLSEGVVVQVDDSQQGVDGKSLGQGSDTRVINPVLWHVDLLQCPDDLQGQEGEKWARGRPSARDVPRAAGQHDTPDTRRGSSVNVWGTTAPEPVHKLMRETDLGLGPHEIETTRDQRG